MGTVARPLTTLQLTRVCLAGALLVLAGVVQQQATSLLQVLVARRSMLWVVGQDQSPDVCSVGHV